MFLSDMNDPEAMEELKEEFLGIERGRNAPPMRWPRPETPRPPSEVYAEEPDC